MKAFAFVLLCALVAVQGRLHSLPNSRTPAALGDAPWVVHLRIAVSTSGLLNSCIGSLIDNRWVLTSAGCVHEARFIWIRYGAVNVINPSLVTETTSVRLHPQADFRLDTLALINITRSVNPTKYIAPISPNGWPSDPRHEFCLYGRNDEGGPGERLNCYWISNSQKTDNGLIATRDDGVFSKYDLGTPLVTNGTQVGVLVAIRNGGNGAEFLLTAQFVDWLEEETGVSFPEVVPEAVKYSQ